MEFSPSKLNTFLFFKLPSAFWSGVRVKSLSADKCEATVRHKATGLITFTCSDGLLIDEAIQKTITTGEGQTIWMKSIGIDSKGDQVSEMEFEWSIKLKAKQ